MASIASSRIGNSLSWSFQVACRSRSYCFAFSTVDRPRRHHYHHTRHRVHRRCSPPPSPPTRRTFSTQSTLFQEPQPSSTSARPATSATKATSVPREPLPQTARSVASNPPQEPIRDVTHTGLADDPAKPTDAESVDWTNSFQGLSTQPFSKETSDVLLAPVDIDDIEIKPDGIIYLPEIKYRRILNRAFGPGGWGLAPRGETIVTSKAVTREYALLAHGRLVSIARGEQDYFDSDGIPTATEGCKSNALMRCCKDLGVASELWDPRFIRKHMSKNAREIWVEHVVSKKRRKIVLRKDDEARYPYKEVKLSSASGAFSG